MKDSELLAKIEMQQRAAEQIKMLQESERALRAEILDACFGDANGTVKTTVSNLLITGTFGLTYTLDQKGVDEAIEEGLLNETELRCIKTKYELDKREFDKNADGDIGNLIQFITVKSAMPTLKIKTLED